MCCVFSVTALCLFLEWKKFILFLGLTFFYDFCMLLCLIFRAVVSNSPRVACVKEQFFYLLFFTMYHLGEMCHCISVWIYLYLNFGMENVDFFFWVVSQRGTLLVFIILYMTCHLWETHRNINFLHTLVLSNGMKLKMKTWHSWHRPWSDVVGFFTSVLSFISAVILLVSHRRNSVHVILF
jgi:hypothetical protein